MERSEVEKIIDRFESIEMEIYKGLRSGMIAWNSKQGKTFRSKYPKVAAALQLELFPPGQLKQKSIKDKPMGKTVEELAAEAVAVVEAEEKKKNEKAVAKPLPRRVGRAKVWADDVELQRLNLFLPADIVRRVKAAAALRGENLAVYVAGLLDAAEI